MAEVKNSFLSSKMNKDLDDRLIPNDQYRDALNISVGKSESSDVGVLQSILGNELSCFTGNSTVTCIGRIADEANNRIFLFFSNYEDPAAVLRTRVTPPEQVFLDKPGIKDETTLTLSQINDNIKTGQTLQFTTFDTVNPIQQEYVITNIDNDRLPVLTLDKKLISNVPIDTPMAIQYYMSIVCFSTTDLTCNTLVSGAFLNFATNQEFNVNGINLIEDLLFWTDNRNQPRKININTALNDSTFYKDETQISVAKYYPLTPITLFDKATINSTNSSTTLNDYTTFTTTIPQANLLKIGYQLISDDIEIGDYIIVNDIIYDTTFATIVLTSLTTTPSINPSIDLTFYGSCMSDASNDPNWTGDTSFMQNKYIRFSYRYKFKDGEYSLMAPFTQIAFIPNQKGFFFSGDETRAYTSTVVEWMQNYVNNLLLKIQLPQLATKINEDYLIEKIDILYKESDALTVKVLESIGVDDIITNSVGNMYTYEYKSQKPYKTLPEAQITRVYDKVPIRAKAQEATGNRVIYGNFIATNTAPSNINYTVSYGNKDKQFDSWIEYPNHNIKQNRSYQVGVILADKFGRQSPVILSSFNKNSSVYVPFSENTTSVRNWPGGVLNITFNNTINSNASDSTGEPGLYANIYGSIPESTDGFQVDTVTIYDEPGYSSANYNNAITFTLTTPSTDPKNTPVLGGYLRGEFVDYVKIIVNPSLNTYICDGTISASYNKKPIPKDIKYSYSINVLGWYSYKIVVKQQQQDYYNVYLPGMLNGYPAYQTSGVAGTTISVFPNNEINRIAHTVLINDNINKVPRDLTEIGPDQRQYRSSVNLFCRVENVGTGYSETSYNVQYFPSTKPDVVSTIATSNELNFLPFDQTTNLYGTARLNFYQLETKPSIARISTVSAVGTLAIPPISISDHDNLMLPTLGIYETTPDVSLLEIFWETTTSGILSDLNEDILLGTDTVNGLSTFVFDFNEKQNPIGNGNVTGDDDSPYITDYFWPLSNGLPIDDSTVVLQVVDLSNFDVTDKFTLEVYEPIIPLTYRRYRIKIASTSNFVFKSDYATKAFFNFTFNIVDNNTTNQFVAYKNNVAMNNKIPIINDPVVDNTEIQIPVNSPGGNIYQFQGNNGSNSLSTVDTNWSIVNVIPFNGSGYFQIDPITGVLSSNIQTSGTYELTIKLTDAYNNNINQETASSLSTTRIIDIVADNIVKYNDTGVQYRTFGQGGCFVNDSGKIDVWQSLLPGETISTHNITMLGYGNPTAPFIPAQKTFIYNGDFTFSWTSIRNFGPMSLTDPRASMPMSYYFQGYFTTNIGRIINLKQPNPYGVAPWITSYGGQQQTPNYFVNDGYPNWRPLTYATFSIKNNSNEQSWWSALNQTGTGILGGAIGPFETVTTYSIGTSPAPQTCLRSGSIHTELGVIPDFTITYGSSC